MVDDKTDISLLGTVVPFNIYKPDHYSFVIPLEK